MFRNSLFLAIGAALLAAGCVPVTEPVGPIDKAEPDKNLIGTWTVTDAGDTAKALELKEITVDAPEVKGNPKGLMRAVRKHNDNELWFFVTTVGKQGYVSLILAPIGSGAPPQFSKEGMFEEWAQAKNKRYFVFRYARDGDKLTIDCGNHGAFTRLMGDEKIKGKSEQGIEFSELPAGWLAKNTDKIDRAKVFDRTNYLDLKREKK